MLGVLPQLLRHGEGWAIEEFTRLGTHSVTHVDAPWHYNSTIQGQPAATIDELPLEWFFADGVVLEMRHAVDGETVQVGDVEAALAAIGYTLKPLDIVLARTGRDAFYGQADYALRGCAVSPEATRWLYERACASCGSTPGAGTGHWTVRPGRPWPGRSRGSSGRRTSATCRTRRSSGW
jgi:kynurenine formamidase